MMNPLGEWVRRLWYLLRRGRRERELQTEMDAHRALMADPTSFGNTLRLREQAADVWGWQRLDRMVRDVALAWRRIIRSPGYALGVVLTLTLAIGVNAAVFTAVDGFALRALPYPEPDRLAALVTHRVATPPGSPTAQTEEDDSFDFSAWRAVNTNVTGVTVGAAGLGAGVNLHAGAANGGGIRYVQSTAVSSTYFATLGVPLYLGRTFTAEEDSPGGPAVAVLTYELWRSAFAADPGVLGSSVELKGEPHTIVGILAPHTLTPAKSDVFTPLRPAATTGQCANPNCGILVRLGPTQTWAEVNAALGRVRLPYFTELETKYHGHAVLYAQGLQDRLAASARDLVSLLMLAVGFILAIACGNLAGLALVRVTRRTPEWATLLALGATRVDLLRQVWIESLILALMGGAAGLGLAAASVSALGVRLPDLMPLGGLTIDARVVGFAVALAVATSVVIGAVPAARARRLGVRSSLLSGTRTVTGGSLRGRQWLIGAEVALTVLLLSATGLFVRTLIHLETLPAGFEGRDVLTAKASLNDARYHDAPTFHALVEASVAAMAAIPGVDEAAMGLSVPYERGLNEGATVLDGPGGSASVLFTLVYITPRYFSAFRIPVVAGRAMAASDTATALPVVVVNRAWATRFFGTTTPLGRHVRIAGVVFEVVGLVADVVKRPGTRGGAPITTEPMAYVSAVQIPQGLVNVSHVWFQPSWIVRTHGPQMGLPAAMQRALTSVAPSLPFAAFASMDELLADQIQVQRAEVGLFATLAGLALLLSAIGIYALVSHLVVDRRREIGLRLALGCSRGRAMVEVGSSGVLAAGLGILAGLGLAVLTLRVLASAIYGTTPTDPLTLAAVATIIAITALGASLVPTLRVQRIEPAELLRLN
jgi:predicted permease